MRLAAESNRLTIILDDGSEHTIEGLWLAPYWQRTPGDYTDEYSRWTDVSIHDAGDALWLRVAERLDYDGAAATTTRDVAFRSADGGRTWRGPESTARPVLDYPVIAELTTHPRERPRVHLR